MAEGTDRIRVAARIRPLSAQEEEKGDISCVSVQDSCTIIATPPAKSAGGPPRRLSSEGPGAGAGGAGGGGGSGLSENDGGGTFAFDATFDSSSGLADNLLQEQVYEQIGRPVLHSALAGISGCLFAYGQTGSGKTYAFLGTEEAAGVLPRLAGELLETKSQVENGGSIALEDGTAIGGSVEEFSVKAAFLELYNENLVDLLSRQREPLRLFESSHEGVVVPGLSESEVYSKDDFYELLDCAMQGRSTGATCVNAHSSRSHALIQLKVQRTNRENTTRAKIHIIDLAGSERQKRARNEGARMREGIHINVSLSALGLVISRLSDIAQGRHHCSVPFRDSKLTFLLKDSLAGNSRTQVLVALSPASSSYEESLSTLRFAQSVKRIRTRVVADIVKAARPSDLQALQAEVERLQAENDALRAAQPSVPVGLSPEPARQISGSSHFRLGNETRRLGVASPVSGPEAVRRLEGCYLSPTEKLIEVSSDGFVRFLGIGGDGHHPIRIVAPTHAEGLGGPAGVLRLQSAGDPDYRYLLVAEEEDALVWQHEDDGNEVRWQRTYNSESGTSAAAEDRVAQALNVLKQLAGESCALSRISDALSSLARSVKPTAALEAFEVLVTLCTDLDEANALLTRRAVSGGNTPSGGTPSGGVGFAGAMACSPVAQQLEGELLRFEATWLAPEPNPEVPARELLQVKVLRQSAAAVGLGSPQLGPWLLTQVWSLPEFGRRLASMKSQIGPAQAQAAEESGSTGLRQRYERLLVGTASKPKPAAAVGVGATPQAPASPQLGVVRSPASSSLSPDVGPYGVDQRGAVVPDRRNQVLQPPLSHRTTPGADTSITPRRSPSPRSSPTLRSHRALPSSLRSASLSALASAAPRLPEGASGLRALQGCYLSSTSGAHVEVDADGCVSHGTRAFVLVRHGDKVLLRSTDSAERGRTYRLLSREPSGVLVWDDDEDLYGDEFITAADGQDGLDMWTPLGLIDDLSISRNLMEDLPAASSMSSAVSRRGLTGRGGDAAVTPLTVREVERLASARLAGSSSGGNRGAPGESSPRRPPLPSSGSATQRDRIQPGTQAGSPQPGVACDGSMTSARDQLPTPKGNGCFSAVARGGNTPGALVTPMLSTPARPRSAELGNDGVQAAMMAAIQARERGRRSRTPSKAGGGSSRRSQSAASVRPKLGTAAGSGESGVAGKAIDKNSLRLRNGSIFVDALARWRVAHARSPTTPPRRLLPGMCAVYVRKRPMFEKDFKRCDFDVLTVLPSCAGDEAGQDTTSNSEDEKAIGQEIVHHACMFDKSCVTPFVSHTTFPFDGVFDADASNEEVYQIVGRPLLDNALDGNLATLFIFGQTGSGKTYTMRAIERMIATELFEQLDGEMEVSLTYFELAGKKALDLLTEQKAEIRLREEEDGCFRPHDCAEAKARDAEELLRVMAEAYGRRATDATTVNSVSSRSHAVCRISVPSRKRQAAPVGIAGSGASKSGCLLLVDCAGTERSRDTMYFKGQHAKESAEINSSLFALKDCIRSRQAAIHRHGGMPQVGCPLRLPSVRATPLTKVLAESLLSASAQLAAIATVSPNATDAEVSIDTLRTVYTLSGRAEGRVEERRQVLE